MIPSRLLGDVQEVYKGFADEGFLEIKSDICAHPTEVGEQLML